MTGPNQTPGFHPSPEDIHSIEAGHHPEGNPYSASREDIESMYGKPNDRRDYGSRGPLRTPAGLSHTIPSETSQPTLFDEEEADEEPVPMPDYLRPQIGPTISSPTNPEGRSDAAHRRQQDADRAFLMRQAREASKRRLSDK